MRGESAAWREIVQCAWPHNGVQGDANWRPDKANWWQNWWNEHWQE